ncbi:MAG TPA: NADH-quinone oxidoreductase subunit M [Candidatus Acidoferrales bacterium]|nr:NADH-quinone oxidoreductase subunit M [Candidatus Acidoferrales bacterium]
MGNTSYILTVLTFFPLLGMFALLLLKGDDHIWIRRLALVTSIVEFLLSLFLLSGFDSGAAGYQLVEYYSWIPSLHIHYHMGVDGISLFLIILTTFLTPLAVLCSWNSIHEHVKEFFAMLLVLEMGMVGVFCALDLFLFFLFWEVMLIPMYFLIGIWGHGRKIYAALKFILYTMLGSILMLVAILWLYRLSAAVGPSSATFDLPAIQGMLSSGQIVLSGNVELLLFLAFFFAFAIKVPLFPLHTWLPDAHAEAPTAGSVILAGVLLKMGTYGMLRFCLPLFPGVSHRLAPEIASLAIIGIVYAALVAMIQKDLKRLVAYTSVSHLGFVVLGIFVFNPTAMEGAIYQMLNHGVSTGMLFLVCGMIYDRRHTYDMKELGGLAKSMPVLCGFFLFACLSSLALPMLNGFIGEFMILIGTFEKHPGWAAWAATGAILSAVYLLWAYQQVALEKITVEKNNSLPDASPRERVILIAGSLVILFMGIFSPMFTHRMDATTNALLEQVSRGESAEAHTRQIARPTDVASIQKRSQHGLAMRSVTLERQARP